MQKARTIFNLHKFNPKAIQPQGTLSSALYKREKQKKEKTK